MINRLISIKLIAAILLFNGCAGIQPGNDPVVVNAERSTSVALETVNTFLKIEYDNKDLVKSQYPQIHTYANFVRKNAPDWIASAKTLTRTYKSNRTPDNKANLQTAIKVLDQVILQATKYLSQINNLHQP